MTPDLPPDVPRTCLIRAAIDYQVPPSVLLAIRKIENGTAGTCGTNTNGTKDCGTMRINTVWIREFNRTENLSEETITNDPCVSLRCAAYIIRYEWNRTGDFWKGVGNLHSRTPSRNALYLAQVVPLARQYEDAIKKGAL